MRIAIIGRSELLYESAERLAAAGHEIALVVTAKEAPEYRVSAEDFAALAERLSAPFLRSARISERIGDLRAQPPIDLAVSVNYPGIIPQKVIDCFRLGVLNAHGGDLPRYRGNACHAWAILNGEERMGLCIHKMVGGALDSGDIIAREYHPITLATKVTHLWDWMKERTPALFEKAVAALAADPDHVLERQSDDPADALRCYPRRPEDGRIDWARSAIEVLRLINASNKPYAGAYCALDGAPLIVWDAEPVEDGENFLAVPGQVTAIGDGPVRVATGDGKIQLNLVERDGRAGPPAEHIGSLRTRLG